MITEIIQNLFVGDDMDAKDFWYSQVPHISIDLTGWNIDIELNRENLETIDKVLQVIKSAYDNDLPTLVYCHAGMDRSPFMVACFIHRELGFSSEYAYKMVKEKRVQTIVHDDWMKLYQSSNRRTRK